MIRIAIAMNEYRYYLYTNYYYVVFGFATTRKKPQEKSVAHHKSRTVFPQTFLGNMGGDAAGNLWFYWVISPNHKKKTTSFFSPQLTL
jgi:hypothetical protein